MAALVVVLSSLLVPAMGFLLLGPRPAELTREVLAAPVPLTAAVRATEAAAGGAVVRAHIGRRGRAWGYVLIVDRPGGAERVWVDPGSGSISRHGRGGKDRRRPHGTLSILALLEAAEQRAGGRAMSADDTDLDGRAAVEVHVASPEGETELYLDAYTAQTLVAMDEKR